MKICQLLPAKRVAFGGEQGSFEMWRRAEPANRSACGNHAVIGQAWFCGRAHDVAHRTRGAGTTRQPGHIAIGRDLAHRDPSHDTEHPTGEDGRIAQRTIASVSARPSARGKVMPVRYANVGATSAGVTVVWY